MSRVVRLILIALGLVCAVGLVLILSGRSRSRDALAKYKTELRAKGEKLTWAELGYPRQAETNDSLNRLLAAVANIHEAKVEPGQLQPMRCVGPGRAQPCWAGTRPWLHERSNTAHSPTWAELDQEMQTAADVLAEIRASMQEPACYFLTDPTDYLNQLGRQLGDSIIAKRTTALWLMGEAVCALRFRQFDRALAKLRTLAKLAQLHKDDPDVVIQQIRAGIAGLGLSVTWGALQAQGWTDEELSVLQKDWEEVDLLDGWRKAMLGSRARSEEFIKLMRNSTDQQRNVPVGGSGGYGTAILNAWFIMQVWRSNSDADELFLLQNYQKRLDALGRAQSRTPWAEIEAELKSQDDAVDAKASNYLLKIRFLGTLTIIPNLTRGTRTIIRYETERRLTVAAIAVERYRLRFGKSPPNVGALVPQFLSAVPIDLMSAKPMRYKLNADGSFTLYSVGEDGRDDGGDASSSGVTNQFGMWSGKDAVWPMAMVEIPEAE